MRLLRIVLALLALPLAAPVATAQYALELHDGASIVFPHDPIMNTDGSATIETWFRAASVPEGDLVAFTRYLPGQEHKGLTIRPDGTIDFIYAGSPWPSGGCAPYPVVGSLVNGDWHHVAFVRRNDASWEVYVDGASVLTDSVAQASGGCCWSTCDVINADAPTRISGSAGWQIRSLRVSDSERYSSPFTPTLDWIGDADTALLLNFTEGRGVTIHDEGAAFQIGEIQGAASWLHLPSEVETYCTGKTNSLGCAPFLTTAGYPSAASTEPFLIRANDVLPGEAGFMLYGYNSNSLSFHGGKLCVKAPVARLLPPQFANSGGGEPCTGRLPRDFNVRIQSGNDVILQPGQTVFAQWLQRDPLDPAGFGDGLTNGVRFTIQP